MSNWENRFDEIDESWVIIINIQYHQNVIINAKMEYPCLEDYVVHLMGSKRCCILWAAEIIPKPSLMIIIDYNWYVWNKLWKKNDPNRSIGQYDKLILLHDNVRPHAAKQIEQYLEGVGNFAQPITGHCSFKFLFVPVHAVGSF